MDTSPEFGVAVVMPVRNAESTIAAAIAAVATQAKELGQSVELVVVDDASTDGTAATASAALSGSGVNGEVLHRGARGGPNASRNAGVLATSAPVVVLLDGDDEPLPGCIRLLAGTVVDDDVIAGGSYVMPGRGGRRAVIAASTRSAFGYRYAVGGACAMTRALFTRVGGFDENIARGGSELEFSITAQLHHDARIVDVDEARVLHRVPNTMWARARVHFLRERGHQHVRRSLAHQGSERDQSPRPAWSVRAERAGGWTLLVAEISGRRLGRVVYGHLAPPAPVARRGASMSD